MNANLPFILDTATLTLTPLGKVQYTYIHVYIQCTLGLSSFLLSASNVPSLQLVQRMQEAGLLELLISLLTTEMMTFHDLCTVLQVSLFPPRSPAPLSLLPTTIM